MLTATHTSNTAKIIKWWH